jgi:uroporphyrinogen decarboxylase
VWERDYRPHLLRVNPARLDIEGNRATLEQARAANKWTFYGDVLVWETARQSLGDVCLYESLILDPGWIHDFNRTYIDFFKAHFQLLFDEVGVPDGIWIYEDLGFKDKLFASPRTFGELIFPYFAEMVEFFHAKGLPVVLHSCGKTTDALPLIVEAGFDAVNPMEVKAGNDLFAFAEQYGDRLAFVGGLDVRYLETNDREIIRREVTRVVEGMKARGARYVFGTDHSVTPLVTYDSYRYALDVYREHMAY